MADTTFKCQCGQVEISAPIVKSATRLKCYCKDCQAFAHHLGAAAILDQNGGSEIVQTGPKGVKITKGQDQIKCLRLGPKGLMRWYAGCCDTPLANTLPDPRIAFIGFLGANMTGNADGFGPVVAIGNTSGATGPDAPQKDSGLATVIAKFAKRVAAARISGSYKQTPFFTFPDRAPIAAPTILSKAERQAATPS